MATCVQAPSEPALAVLVPLDQVLVSPSSDGGGYSLLGVNRIDASWKTAVGPSSVEGNRPSAFGKLPATLVPTTVSTLVPKSKLTVVPAATAGIPLAPAVVAVLVPTSSPKNWAALILAAETALLPILRGVFATRRPAATVALLPHMMPSALAAVTTAILPITVSPTLGRGLEARNPDAMAAHVQHKLAPTPALTHSLLAWFLRCTGEVLNLKGQRRLPFTSDV